jgi:hypothetical protein
MKKKRADEKSLFGSTGETERKKTETNRSLLETNESTAWKETERENKFLLATKRPSRRVVTSTW